MSRTGHTRDNWEEGKRHREVVARKYERIRGLESLINTHEFGPNPDYVYIHKLKSKLHIARLQLKAMAGADSPARGTGGSRPH